MGNATTKLPSGIDLIEEAIKHYEFVRELNFTPSVFHPNNVKSAIVRYEKYWLPLCKHYPTETLIAPFDIELIWIVHMLNPTSYERDCMNIANQIINHTVSTKFIRHQDRRSEELWIEMYNTPFHIDVERIPTDVKPYRSELHSHLVNAVKEYREFIRQVSLPHFQDEKFLQFAFQTYIEGALSGDLRKMAYPYHNSFMWKTHQINPVQYKRDVKYLKERRMHSSVASRRSVRSTKSMSGYGQRKRRGSLPLPPVYNQENQMIDGAMYRGENTPLQKRLPYESLLAMAKKIHNFSVAAYRIQDLEPNLKYQLMINARSKSSKDGVINLLTFDIDSRGTILVKTFPRASDHNSLAYDEDKYESLQIGLVEIRQTQSTDPTQPPHLIKSATYLKEYRFPHDQQYVTGAQFKITFKLRLVESVGQRKKEEIDGWINFQIHKPTMGLLRFSFAKDVNHINRTTHYCDILKFPLMMVPYATKLHDAPANYLKMLINDSYGNAVFRCRILQAESGEFSSVEIFDMKDNVVASSYTIGKESLPNVDQIGHPETCCILRDVNEMVFVIRSTNYEWGILKVFQDFRMHDFAPAGILFFNLKAKEQKWERLYDQENRVNIIYFKSKRGGLFVNLEQGSMTLPPLYREFPDLLSLGATILTLFCVRKFQRM